MLNLDVDDPHAVSTVLLFAAQVYLTRSVLIRARGHAENGKGHGVVWAEIAFELMGTVERLEAITNARA